MTTATPSTENPIVLGLYLVTSSDYERIPGYEFDDTPEGREAAFDTAKSLDGSFDHPVVVHGAGYKYGPPAPTVTTDDGALDGAVILMGCIESLIEGSGRFVVAKDPNQPATPYVRVVYRMGKVLAGRSFASSDDACDPSFD